MQTEIAEALGVTEGAVSQCFRMLRDEEVKGLLARPHTGRPPELRLEQKNPNPDPLSHGAEAYGFREEVWTNARVAKVIEWEWAVTYHPSHVARLLKELKWTPQLPIVRATQRDDETIAQWLREQWPELRKRARLERRRLVFVDEPGFNLLPARVRTYATRGQPPTLQAFETRDHLSVMNAITS